MATEAIYSDSLIAITEEAICFRGYGFFGGDRFVSFTDIEEIRMKKPTFWNGKWRWHGTGDFKTWFPKDYNRQTREWIFIARIRGKWWRIGFTVEDSSQVAGIFREKGFLNNGACECLSEQVTLDRQNSKTSAAAWNAQKIIFWLVVLVGAVILPLVALCLYLFGYI